MKAPTFDYRLANSLDDLFDAFDEHGDEAQILAGGQSLMASLNLRLSSPALLVDINGLDDLAGIDGDEAGGLRIGALARHAAVAADPLIAGRLPLIARAMPHVAHPAIRNRGTFGGSLALGDPAAELPACAVALGAELVLQSRAGRRTVAAEDYYLGLYETARAPEEILVEGRFAKPDPKQRCGFTELARRHGDFAIVGIACVARIVEDTTLSDLRLVVFGSESHPRLAANARAAAEGADLSEASRARIAEALMADIEPMDNLQGSADYKRAIAGVLCRRAIGQMIDTVP